VITPQHIYRKSCNGVLIRFRVNPGDNSWLVIERKGNEREYHDIKEEDVLAVVDRFIAIKDPATFDAFVESVS